MSAKPSRTLAELEALADKLTELLGADQTYVLVLGDNGTHRCNCISNAPVEYADQLRQIFRELSERPVRVKREDYEPGRI